MIKFIKNNTKSTNFNSFRHSDIKTDSSRTKRTKGFSSRQVAFTEQVVGLCSGTEVLGVSGVRILQNVQITKTEK